VWTIPDTDGCPIMQIGIELSGASAGGTLYVDWLTWDNTPNVTFYNPGDEIRWWNPTRWMWQRAWINGAEVFDSRPDRSFHLIQNEGRGLVSQGTREWTDYSVSAPVYVYLAQAAGIGARVQGMKRYYALLLCSDGKARLVKALDGEKTLAEIPFALEADHAYDLKLEVVSTRLRGWIDGKPVFDVEDTDRPLADGAVALICETGRMGADTVTVTPL
jgi:hypothetical protein